MFSSQQAAQDLLSDLKLRKLTAKQREEMYHGLVEHFSKVIVSTALKRLTEEQYADFKAALSADDPEDKIAEIAAQVPGLAELIEIELEREYRTMKAIMS